MARLSKATVPDIPPTDPITVDELATSAEGVVHASQHTLSEDEADDERRESLVSISSIPESTFHSDNDLVTPILDLYSPRSARATPRWSEHNIRNSKATRSPFGSPSTRRAKWTPSGSRTGTPRAAWSATGRGSPRPRRRISELTEVGDIGEAAVETQYPLVLLHVSLLPVTLPWSAECMREILPVETLEHLQHLRSKISETMLGRGILISHPREEYDLLEERVLEALGLKEERVTKSGHFRHDSTRSFASDSDSGVGSSVEGDEEEDLCAICRHHIKPSHVPVADCQGKWSVRVFAANGLMHASAWSAAWADMESVDVEILPWVSEAMRRELDLKMEQEDAEGRDRDAEEEEAKSEEKIREIVEERLNAVLGERSRGNEERRHGETAAACDNDGADLAWEQRRSDHSTSEIPPIYRPSQIPLSVLLKNYFYLLMQDRRNVAAFFIAILVGALALRSFATPTMRFDTWDDGFMIRSEVVSGVEPVKRDIGKMSGLRNDVRNNELVAAGPVLFVQSGQSDGQSSVSGAMCAARTADMLFDPSQEKGVCWLPSIEMD